MGNRYSMQEQLEMAKRASTDIEAFLRSLPYTLGVINVEDDKDYQKIDVDLLWVYKWRNQELLKKVEIKGDRYYWTGNYFIETISNKERNNPGCFMYTEADYLFYYFADTKELNVMPMPDARKWFLQHTNEFQIITLSTTDKNKTKVLYTSEGKLVPKRKLNGQVPGIHTRIIH